MLDLSLFLRQCAASGTLIASLCAVVTVPFAAWVAVRLITPYLLKLVDDRAWQAALTCLAAMTPGATFLTLALIGLFGAQSAGCLQFLWGRIIFDSILIITIVALTRATVLAFGRARQVCQLVASSRPAGGEGAALARQVGVELHTVEGTAPFCALAGILRPVVLMSIGALTRLSALELEAALQHEKAHAVRRDLLLAAMVRFFTDLLPLPVNDLVDTYYTAREFAADDRARRCSSAEDLASAIVSLAVSLRRVQPVAGLAENSKNVKARVVALLQERSDKSNAVLRRLLAAGSLSLIMVLSFTPAVLAAINYHACSMAGTFS